MPLSSPALPGDLGRLWAQLTPRERDVLRHLVSSPAPGREISRQLGISPLTLREYASRIYRKGGVSCRLELIFACAGQVPLPRLGEVLGAA